MVLAPLRRLMGVEKLPLASAVARISSLSVMMARLALGSVVPLREIWLSVMTA